MSRGQRFLGWAILLLPPLVLVAVLAYEAVKFMAWWKVAFVL